MRKVVLSLISAVGILAANAQNNDLKKAPSFGFQFSFIDYQTAADLRTKALPTVLDEKQWYRLNRQNPGLTLTYQQGISNNVDFGARLTGAFMPYPLRNVVNTSQERFYAELDANVHVKLLPDNFTVVPYLTAGAGVLTTNNNFGAYIPLGGGLQINLWNDAFVHLQTAYRSPVTAEANYSLFHSIGISVPLSEKKPAPVVNVPVVPKDTDGDGIIDDNDKCPTVPGVAKYQGCPVPDTDGDGINDDNDKCPNEKGIAKYQGCPIPDTDKDGLNDEEDKCPNVAGLARYQGCPIPDSDKDGINDEEDKCPAVAGLKELAGCPRPDIEPSNIVFKTGSAVLLPSAKKELEKAVNYLNTYKGFNVVLEGHTDNTGSDKINLPLSQKRAEATKTYLVSRGVDAGRLSAEGFGSSRPVADNSTPEGRAKNRRVELVIK